MNALVERLRAQSTEVEQAKDIVTMKVLEEYKDYFNTERFETVFCRYIETEEKTNRRVSLLACYRENSDKVHFTCAGHGFSVNYADFGLRNPKGLSSDILKMVIAYSMFKLIEMGFSVTVEHGNYCLWTEYNNMTVRW